MTRLLVLGLLKEQPMSGYDIQQKIKGADAGRWGGVLVGSIYHALKRLEDEGYIGLDGVEWTGHRQRALYQITDQGKDELRRLVFEALRTSTVQYPTTLYSGLSLLDQIPREQARKALEEQKGILCEEYCALERGEKSNEGVGKDISPFSGLTIAHMMETIRRQQRFVDDILEVLEE